MKASGNDRQTLNPNKARRQLHRADEGRAVSRPTGARKSGGQVQVVFVDFLPMHGDAWLLYPDLDLVAVSSHLDAAGRDLALADAGIAAGPLS